MPLLTSAYLPPRWLRGAHVATILPTFFPAPPARWTQHERLELEDGDFLDLAWLRCPDKSQQRLAILSHGLEGSLNAPYIRHLARTLSAHGWDVLAWNYRSCGGLPNRLLRSYHSGESGDLRILIQHAALTHPDIALIGFSLGGNITLKYVSEAPPHPAVHAAIGISAPVDLASCAHALDHRRGNRLYLHRFLKTLLAKAFYKAQQFPGTLNPDILRNIRSIRAFDDAVTAPLHGFASAEDYWARASALPTLPNLTIPALLLNARNDPLLDTPCFPEALAKAHPFFHLEAPTHGGHVGFPDPHHSWAGWHEWRIMEFLRQALG